MLILLLELDVDSERKKGKYWHSHGTSKVAAPATGELNRAADSEIVSEVTSRAYIQPVPISSILTEWRLRELNYLCEQAGVHTYSGVRPTNTPTSSQP